MILAVIFAMIVMLIFSQKISDFINNRPTIKMLALAFLILIGLMLVMEGMHQHVNKGYIYFAMTFALVVELFNDKLRRKSGAPIQLKKSKMIAKINASQEK
jgi:predicted tellurium resistance membrane protein TerC